MRSAFNTARAASFDYVKYLTRSYQCAATLMDELLNNISAAVSYQIVLAN